MSECSVCIVLWHDHVNGEIKALKKKKKKNQVIRLKMYTGGKEQEEIGNNAYNPAKNGFDKYSNTKQGCLGWDM